MVDPGELGQPDVAFCLEGIQFFLCRGSANLGLLEDFLVLLRSFLPLHQGLLNVGLLALDPSKFILEPRHFVSFLLEGSGVRGVLVLQHLLKLLVGPLEFVVVQKQLLEYCSPGVGALLKRAKG